MKKYRIKYYLYGDIKIVYIAANNEEEALVLFYLNYQADDVISVVLEDV